MNDRPASNTASVSAVFTSIQGEGAFAGQMHRFVRFSGCNLSCPYCDTPDSRDSSHGSEYEIGSLLGEIADDDPRGVKMVALTGGEPLVQADFIRAMLIKNRSENAFSAPVLLETNGTLPGELEKVIQYVDWISMDIKLPDDAGIPDAYVNPAEDFLKISYLKRVYAKIVVCEGTSASQFRRAVRMIASVDASIPLYIQPVTPYDNITVSPSSEALLELYREASAELEDVRVMPQIHKLLGLE